MVYRVIGLMSGSSLDGLDIAFVEFQEQGGKWSYEILETACYSYPAEWTRRLQQATELPARDYLLLHTEYGHYTGQQVNRFIDDFGLHFKVALVSSHGHTSFHLPAQKMTAQLGDGAAIAAVTKLPVVSDLRSLDVALGGQGAPIVPIGEKLLFDQYGYFLNIGGIANISLNGDPYIAFDICPANRVLNLLAKEAGQEYDKDGALAASGSINTGLLAELNGLDYYKKSYPKSLANDFGTGIVFPLIRERAGNTEGWIAIALRTFTEHIAEQVRNAVVESRRFSAAGSRSEMNNQLLLTGGGAFNLFLVDRLKKLLGDEGIGVVVPDKNLVNFKEALIMAFIGVLRWRQEYNVLPSVTGAGRASIGGALWTGEEA